MKGLERKIPVRLAVCSDVEFFFVFNLIHIFLITIRVNLEKRNQGVGAN